MAVGSRPKRGCRTARILRRERISTGGDAATALCGPAHSLYFEALSTPIMDPYTFSLTLGGVGLGVMALSGFAQAVHVGHGHGAHGHGHAHDSHAGDGHTTHVPAGGARPPGRAGR